MSTAAQERRDELASPIGRWRRMTEARLLEERIQTLFADGYIRGSTHLASGQEAVAVGLASCLELTDTVTCTYRGHATAIALGMPADALLGELCGRQSGSSRGIGGSMHLADRSIGLMPTFAIVGAGLPVAVGVALAAQTRSEHHVAVAFCGDGATNIGAFHESLNMAAVWALPVVFVVENNLYGEYSPIRSTTPVDDLAVRATGYGMPSEIVDGQDVDAVREAAHRALVRARNGQGPTLLEMKTYRYSGHSRSDAATYRPAGELHDWLDRDPLTLSAGRLVADGLATQEQLNGWRGQLEAALEAATERALAAEPPAVAEMLSHVESSASARHRPR